MSTEEHNPANARFRSMVTRSAIRPGEGSFRGIFSSLGKTLDRSGNGPSIREMNTAYYLREEMQSARQAVKQLDAAVSGAQSFREAASKLREEAHRAMGRLERVVAQVVDSEHVDPDLIGIACDIACAAKRGITLVDVYGKYSTMVKIMTIFLRSYIHSKFEKQTELLKKLNPPVPSIAALRAQVPLGPSSVAQSQQHGGSYALSTSSVPSTTAAGGSGAGPLSAIPEGPSKEGRGPAGTTSAQTTVTASGPSQVGPQPPPPLPPPVAAQPLVGTMLQSHRHEKVLALAYLPAGQVHASDFVSIWWSVGQRLEFYSEETQSTTVFQEATSVTAVGVDKAGSVWTGHAKGHVRVRYKQHWELTVEEKAFTTTVKTIAFDEQGRAWAGDESGRIKVLEYDPEGGNLATVAALQRSAALWTKMKGATGNLFGKRHCNNSGTSGQASAAAVFAAANAAAAAVTAAAAAAARDGSPGNAASAGVSAAGATASALAGSSYYGAVSSSHTPPGTMEGPVRCIFVRGNRAWASGGRSCAWLQLWDADTLQDLDVYECGPLGPCHAMAALRWPSAASSAGPSFHLSRVSKHRHTHSDGVRAAQPPPTGAYASDHVSGLPGCSWRLLTGHENGQLLLWHPEHRNLAPLLRIGDPGSPCRGIAAFEAFNLVVTGHQGGQLHLFRQPAAESSLPPGADSVSPQTLGTHRPKMVIVAAHKSRLDRMTCGATSCVTASILGTIRLWHAAELAAEAQRLGLVFTQHTPSYSSLQSAAELTPMATYSNASSQYGRESAKSPLSELPQHGCSQLASPIVTVSAGGGSNLSAATLAAAPSGMSSTHLRESSKDSMDTAGGPSSANTGGTLPYTADAPGGGPPNTGQVTSGTTAAFQHFQTIDYAELQVLRKIGSGAYGEVLLAEWTGSEVAVKKLFAVQNMDDKEYSTLMNEVTLLGSLNHPNIARFLAMCVDPPCIVMQYYPYGSLFDLLNRALKGSPKAAKELTWSKRLDMLRDVASGMHYLHSRKPPVIHGDLRSPNLLLDMTIDRERPRFHVRIADFGLARMAPGATGSVMVSKTTNPRWLAPEVIKNSTVGKAADVYSFSIIMWEMLTWRQPYQDMMSFQVLFATVTDNSRPEVPPDAELPGGPGTSLPLYRQLMESCWQADAAQRPSFKDIVEVLQSMLKVETDSPRPQRLPQPMQPSQGTGTMQRQSQLQQQLQGPTPAGGETDPSGHVPVAPAANGSGNIGAGALGPSGAAGGSVSAPSTGGNGLSPAAATVAAAARRTISTGVTSPFMCTTALTAPGEAQVDKVSGVTPPEGGHTPLGTKQYGSVLSLYGMSPILEETASATATAASQPSSAVSNVTPGIPSVSATGCMATIATPQETVLPVPQRHQNYQQHHISHPHPHPHLHPHVHFAPTSPFAQSAADGSPSSGPASVSCPTSPMLRAFAAVPGSQSARGFSAANPNPLSSASSTEGGVVHAVSAGSNIAGAPSTATSRQSSASTSGRTLGAAVATGTATMVAPIAVAPAAGRIGGAGPAATVTASRHGVGHGANTDRRNGGSGTLCSAATTPTSVRTPVTEAQKGAAAGDKPQGTDPATGHPWPLYTTPMVVAKSITCLSPFACMPAEQLGELDAAAPRLAAIVGEYVPGAAAVPTAASGVGHARSAAPQSPRNSGILRTKTSGSTTLHSGPGGRGVGGASSRPGYHSSGVPLAAPVPAPAPSIARGRVSGTSGSHIAVLRTGGTGGGSGTLRRIGGSCNSQPNTPPHHGPQATASPLSRSGGGHGSRQASVAGALLLAGGSAPGRSHSNDRPSSSGGSGSGCRFGSACGDTVPQTVAVSSQLSLLAGRLSHSAAHAHVDGGHDDHATGLSRPPGHRRTPSGGFIGGNAAVGRDRDIGLTGEQEGLHAAPHPRTQSYTPRGSSVILASPRSTTHNPSSSTAEPRSGAAARRPLAILHSGGSNAILEMAGSPSSAHLSRLSAAARAPDSPRSLIPGGPGSTLGHVSSAVSGAGGVSRIPSLVHATAHGSGQSAAGKRSTYRSLDDESLRRLGLCEQASSLPPIGSAAGSPVAVGRASAALAAAESRSPLAAASDSGWEEGLNEVRRSPEVTQEVPLDSSDGGGDGSGSGGGGGMDPMAQQQVTCATGVEARTQLPSLQRIATSQQQPTTATKVMVEAPAWQPPPLLAAATVGCKSPFAEAAYASPFFRAEREPAGEHNEAPPDVGELDGLERRRGSSGVAVASTSPTVRSGQHTKKAPGPAARTAGLVVSTVPARVAAAAPKSPSAHAAEQDSWWEEAQHHDD